MGKAPAAHPPYASMITAAIKALGDKKGSSRQAILKYVVANNKVDAAKAAVRVRLALKKMIAAKKVVAAAAAGKKGAGSFKLPAKEPKAKKAKKPKAKKPAAKKSCQEASSQESYQEGCTQEEVNIIVKPGLYKGSYYRCTIYTLLLFVPE